jgi:hypothetical protein
MLEFYEGFQKKPDEDNRYGTECEDGYYPCRLVAEIPLGTNADEALQLMNEALKE